ncbi:MAG: glycosyltransferase family 4 protein, partial [Armatimonadota bacterium]|nr:glycosyltransferase family 4 protein [Armatimonadota bacterium]
RQRAVMRILNTVEFYHPHLGGAERVVQRISEGLVHRGHEVTVATSYDPRRPVPEHNGVHIRQFRIAGNCAKGMTGEVRAYQEWLLRGSWDVMMNYAAQSWPTDAALPLLERLRPVRVLATCGFSGQHGIRRALYARYFRMLRTRIRHYDALIYHADTGADVAFGRRFGPGEQAVIPNGVDGEEFATPRHGFRIRYRIGDRPLLLHVGNHYRVKGHRDLLRVARDLADLDALLVIIGRDPGGWGSCWRACARASHRNPGVVLLSEVPRAEVVSAFVDADVVLLTSRFEAAPLVLVEAMAAGVTFVSYRVGNAAALPGGLVVDGPADMARAVRELIGDVSRRRALGREGQVHQRRLLDWAVLVEKYEELFRRLHSRAASRGPAQIPP